MVSSAVGYDEPDVHNRDPKYCSRCRRKLKPIETGDEYDPYTGKPIRYSKLTCPTLSSFHDMWKREAYGAWVNYRGSA